MASVMGGRPAWFVAGPLLALSLILVVLVLVVLVLVGPRRLATADEAGASGPPPAVAVVIERPTITTTATPTTTSAPATSTTMEALGDPAPQIAAPEVRAAFSPAFDSVNGDALADSLDVSVSLWVAGHGEV
ncbi:MAG: hypothetical protein ACR2NL_04255, partial [Acidimicrobiia bacterium]